MHSKRMIAALSLGFAMAALLLFNSVRSYRQVSARLEVAQVRRAAQQFAASFEERASQAGAAPVETLLAQQVKASGGAILSAHLRDGRERVLAQGGIELAPQFTNAQLLTEWQRRRSVFRRVRTASGDALVEAFPVRWRGTAHSGAASAFRLASLPDTRSVSRGAILEIAASLDGNADSFLLRRNLLINGAAAFALMAALVVIAARWKAYLRGQSLAVELDDAAAVQRQMMPRTEWAAGRLAMSAHYAPAGQVGGDFYDTFEVEPGKTAILLGDVSGKGVPASLLTGLIEGAVRGGDWAGSAAAQEKAATKLNGLLCDRATHERYATMFWSSFDAAAMRLSYINAGHFPPLLFRARGGDVETLNEGGPVLGILRGAAFRQATLEIAAGDLLVAYSDGIVEASNAQGEPFGEDRLRHAVELYLDRPVEEIRDQVLAAVRNFAGSVPADDDRTLWVVRFPEAA